MNIKDGFKTVEMYVGLLTAILISIWPQFPQESVLALGAWVIARSGQKMFGFDDPITGKPSYKTSEFWGSLIYAIIVAVFPDVPQEALYSVLGWTGLRTAVKIKSAIS